MILTHGFVSVNPFLIYLCDCSYYLRFFSISSQILTCHFIFYFFSKDLFCFIIKSNYPGFADLSGLS